MEIMQNCCICHSTTKAEFNIYNDQIGEPSVPIIEVIQECISDFFERQQAATEEDIKDIYICLRCSGKLVIFQKASLLMKKVTFELHALMDDGTLIQKDEISDEYSQDSQDCENLVDSLADLSQDIAEEVQELEEFEEDCTYSILYFPEKPEIAYSDSQEVVETEELEIKDYIKSEVDESKFKSSDNSAFDEIIEIEQLDEEILIESTQESNSAETQPTKNYRKKISTCTDCDLKFTSKRAFHEHRRNEHFAGFVCDQCGKTFFSQSGFITHSHTHKPVKEHVCSVCGEGFHHKGYLKRHMAWHSGEMPFACDICPKRFVHKVALYKHKKVHEDIRNVVCAVCGFKFRTRAHLNRHMMTHTGAKPHSCPICGKCFSQVYNMKVHIKEHEKPGSTRRRRYKCKICSKTFTAKDKYEEHIAECKS